MKIVNPMIHGILDYATVVMLCLAPQWLGLSESAVTFGYALAGVHLLLTATTDFPLGIVKVVPLRTHGKVELGVGAVLLGASWLVPVFTAADQVAYTLLGMIILLLWWVTDYRPAYAAPASDSMLY